MTEYYRSSGWKGIAPAALLHSQEGLVFKRAFSVRNPFLGNDRAQVIYLTASFTPADVLTYARAAQRRHINSPGRKPWVGRKGKRVP